MLDKKDIDPPEEFAHEHFHWVFHDEHGWAVIEWHHGRVWNSYFQSSIWAYSSGWRYSCPCLPPTAAKPHETPPKNKCLTGAKASPATPVAGRS